MSRARVSLTQLFFQNKLWNESRVFSKAEAFLDLISYSDEDTLHIEVSRRTLENKWQWSGTKVSNFINSLVDDKVLNQLQKATKKTSVLSLSIDVYKEVETIRKATKKPVKEKPTLFTDIKNVNAFANSFQENKIYFLIAYKFWNLWWNENPTKTLQDAQVFNWYNYIKLIIETDKQSPDRLIGVYEYFLKCQKSESGYKDFWYNAIKSVGAFRKKDKEGVYYLDKIIHEVNQKIKSDVDFGRLVFSKIDKFHQYAGS